MNTTTTETTPATPTATGYWMPSHNKDGSFNWRNWGCNQRVGAGLPRAGNRKAVWLELCGRANADGQCWPSQARIAQDTEMSERQVGRELDGLERDGWITRQKRKGEGGTFRSDLITINVSKGVMH